MFKKTDPLPEIIISDSNDNLSKLAKSALDARAMVNESQADEDIHRKSITTASSIIREKKSNDDEFIGKIVISPPGQSAIRVEFRVNSGSLDVDEMNNLDKLFGPARPELFERVEIVKIITDPETLIESLKKAGLNPWDYVSLDVKKDMDTKVIENGTGFETGEAILPRKGLLSKLNCLVKTLSEDAKLYMRAYLKLALKPTVVLGTKNNKKG